MRMHKLLLSAVLTLATLAPAAAQTRPTDPTVVAPRSAYARPIVAPRVLLVRPHTFCDDRIGSWSEGYPRDSQCRVAP
jgi:hypothetical protein